jgi:hypothetical protein
MFAMGVSVFLSRFSLFVGSLCVGALGLASLSAHADELRVGRYARLPIVAPAEPLSTPITTRFVAARTVGDAARLSLAGTGYQLVDGANADPMQASFLQMSLPASQRDLSHLPAIDALVVIGKPGYRVMVDHIHRLVGFEVRPRYRDYANTVSSLTDSKSVSPTSSDPTGAAASQWHCVEQSGRFQCVPATVRS